MPLKLQVPVYRLVRCIVSIRNFFDAMLSPPPLPETTLVGQCLFPKYWLYVSQWYSDMHLNEHEFGELMTGAFVRKLYLVKASFGSPHEHIIAEIHNRTIVDPPQVRYLRLERVSGNFKMVDQERRDQERRREERREQKRRQRDSESNRQASADTVSDVSSDSYCKHIYDVVDAVKEIPSWVPKDLVYTVTFTNDDHVPPLSDLAIAARVAHEEDEQYSLLEHQCYWWADTLMAILESLVDETYRTKQVYNKERKRDNEAQSTQTRSGKLCLKWVDVPIDNRTNAAHLNSGFEACKAPLVERRVKIAAEKAEVERIEAETERIIAETERMREGTERITAETERSREETARMMEETERLREEAERLREEVKRMREEAERNREHIGPEAELETQREQGPGTRHKQRQNEMRGSNYKPR